LHHTWWLPTASHVVRGGSQPSYQDSHAGK